MIQSLARKRTVCAWRAKRRVGPSPAVARGARVRILQAPSAGAPCGGPPGRGRAFPAWRPATTLSKEKATHFHFSPNHLETSSEKNYLVKTLVAFQVRLRCEYKQGCAPSRRGGEGATLTPAVTTRWVKPVRGRQAGTASALGPSPPHSPLPSASYCAVHWTRERRDPRSPFSPAGPCRRHGGAILSSLSP